MTDNQKKPLVILTGPTAVGKTELSVRLAKRINGEIISADSMQVYRRMDIGTAKIKPEETDGVAHHLIDILEPQEDFNVCLFKELAKKAVNEIYSRGRVPIIAGGTGFYIQAVLYDIDFTETETDGEYRMKLLQTAKEKGADFLHAMLREIDPQAADAIHPNNVKRVMRAIEYHHQTGGRMSEHNEKQSGKESPYNFVYFVLNDDRAAVYERIDRRVDMMLENGLLDEVKSLLAEGCDKSLTSMKGLGYKELIDYINGETTFEEAVRILKRDTRHFAKRQLTWFGRERGVTFVNLNEFDGTTRESVKNAALDYMLEILHNKNIM